MRSRAAEECTVVCMVCPGCIVYINIVSVVEIEGEKEGMGSHIRCLPFGRGIGPLVANVMTGLAQSTRDSDLAHLLSSRY